MLIKKQRVCLRRMKREKRSGIEIWRIKSNKQVNWKSLGKTDFPKVQHTSWVGWIQEKTARAWFIQSCLFCEFMSSSLLVLLLEGHRGPIGFLAVLFWSSSWSKKEQKGSTWLFRQVLWLVSLDSCGDSIRDIDGSFQCTFFVHFRPTLLVSVNLASSFLTILPDSSATKEEDPAFGF